MDIKSKSILLVYIGFEQGAWGNISYPKPQHYYVMPGILYCAAALKAHPLTRDLDIKCLYLNKTMQSVDDMFSEIIALSPDMLGFSSFCWNKTETLDLAARYRAASPESIILLGGPDVGMKDAGESNAYFEQTPFIDGLVFGESEEKLPAIARALLDNNPAAIGPCKGYALNRRFGGSADFDQTHHTDLAALPSPYPFDLDVKRSPDCGLGMVYETGRGCPYRCIYCQFSHRDNQLRRFDMSRVEQELTWLLESRIDCIHFADPVFDLEPERAKRLLRFLIARNICTTFFFYCSFQKLDDELAMLFARSQCQIGVGVQSTNPAVLKTIQRGLSPRLFESIRDLLAKYRLNFYTDLIFGLPQDHMTSFQKSFEDCLKLGPSFMMLFPLTLIKGTPLEAGARGFGMVQYNKDDVSRLSLMCDIEYHNTALFKDFSIDDLESFDDMALTCFYFYNRFHYSLAHLQNRAGDSAAQLYRRIGRETKAYLKSIGKTANNTERLPGFEDVILRIFTDALKDEGAGPAELKAFGELFKLDIYRIIILNAPQRHKHFANAQKLKAVGDVLDETAIAGCQLITGTFGKKITIGFALNDLLNLAHVQEKADERPSPAYLHAPFERWDVQVMQLSAMEETIIDRIPADRPVRYASVRSACARMINDDGKTDAVIYEALCGLVRDGVIRMIQSSDQPKPG